MHELSLAHNVVRILCDEADRNGMARISRYRLQLGLLRAVVPDLLRTCLEFVGKGTLIEGASIEIEEVAGQARCPRCGLEYVISEILFLCPQCEQVGGEILTGEELRLIELEGE